LTPHQVEIQEGTVHWVEGARVGAGSICVRDYPDPEGVVRAGPSALIAVGDHPRFVGSGDILTIGSQKWRVTVIAGAGGSRGAVRLESSGA
jgi:hypothetical protein